MPNEGQYRWSCLWERTAVGGLAVVAYHMLCVASRNAAFRRCSSHAQHSAVPLFRKEEVMHLHPFSLA